MKKYLFISSLFLVSILLLSPTSSQALVPFDGKVIALDAGHGGTEIGAVNSKYNVLEKDVNLKVAYATKAKLETAGAKVVLTRTEDETLTSRQDRVNLASQKCYQVADKECDALISIHHNGSTDVTHDGTSAYVTQKKDVALGDALYKSLLRLGLPPEGLHHNGFGMTVYGKMPNTLTEAYYITNDWEAQQYLYGPRVDQEADVLYQGLSNYFTNLKPPRKGQ